MSYITFETQFDKALSPASNTQNFNTKGVLIYADPITERQSALMKQCQDCLRQSVELMIKKEDEIESLPKKMIFVISRLKEDLIEKIRNHCRDSRIYLPRAVIEARCYHGVKLPTRVLTISLTMHHCKIFLAKYYNDHPDKYAQVKNKIHKMSGELVDCFSNPELNVMVTDRADDKYCIKAFEDVERSITVVSERWIDDNFMNAGEEESGMFNRDALSNIDFYRIKPFFGLAFKFRQDVSSTSRVEISKLIAANQGHIIYGDEECTHIVIKPGHARPTQNDQSDSYDKTKKPKYVDEDYLKFCVNYGYLVRRRKYLELTMTDNVIVKQEFNPNVNQAFFSPPQVARPLRQQTDNTLDHDAIVQQALSSFEPAPTQLVSTQMSRLPDPKLNIEPAFEPSQQLFWIESGSRRN